MGFEPTTFGLEVQRASPLRHAGLLQTEQRYLIKDNTYELLLLQHVNCVYTVALQIDVKIQHTTLRLFCLVQKNNWPRAKPEATIAMQRLIIVCYTLSSFPPNFIRYVRLREPIV